MKKTNNKSAKRKLIPAIAMLTCSAVMLSTATYAWFTMNKEVKVTGMEVKAHAEEGLLVNEKAEPGNTWDDVATANQITVAQAIQLRPASTKDLSSWWHANSKKTDNEAGYGSGTVDTANTVKIGTSDYYTNISSLSADNTPAVAGSQAETNVYYKDATYGTSGSYDNGEGFYVKYTYYIKSSSSETMTVAKNKFMVNVTATKKNEETSGTSDKLDKALRVGVKIGDDYLIFVPNGGSTSYKVTSDAQGSAYTDAVVYTTETAIGTTGNLSIPAVTANGMQADVYVWFEGEDPECKSDNLTTVLDTYNIDVTFRDADFS